MEEPIIQLRGIKKVYTVGVETIHALRGVDLDIRRNEMVAIMGSSGSGKSTLMNTLGCLDRPTEGEYRLGTRLVSAMRPDELALVLRGLLGEHADRVSGVAALSTVPAVLREVRSMLSRYYPKVPRVVVEPGVRTGVPLLVDNPKEVGSDRIANTLAAHTAHGTACVVVDFGTITNIDVVSAKGEFLGGVFLPGIEISVDALATRAAALRKVEAVRPRSVIGRSTVECLQSGIMHGYAAQVDGLVHKIDAELRATGHHGPRTVIATGGLAPVVLQETTTIDHHAPDLTLQGLRLIFERNRR